MVKHLAQLLRRFDNLREDEDGIALTEYVMLLGLLAGAVIAAVTLFGQNLSTIWDAWATWVGSLNTPS